MSHDRDLQEAIDAIKSGDKQKARQLLAQIIKQNPWHEMAWLRLASITNDLDKQYHCLEQVLKINPNNEIARNRIAQLDAIRVERTQKPSVPPKSKIKPLKPAKLKKDADTKICPYCAETIKKQATVCRYCGKELGRKAEVVNQSIPAKPVKQKKSNMRTILLVVILFICGLMCLIPNRASRSPTRTPTPTLSKAQINATATIRAQGTESGAIAYCRLFIKDQLISPKSADFHWDHEAWRIKGKPGYWSVTGTVDAVNAFNVELTNTYGCDLHYNASNDTWHIDYWFLE